MQLLIAWLGLGTPWIVWVGSYILLVHEFGAWDLLRAKVHESGKLTLAETVLYYNHFLRELPIDTLIALAILWSYSVPGIRLFTRVPPAAAGGCLGLFLAWVFTGSLLKVGWRNTLADLFQYREREDLIGWGSHWQMHFLSTAALLVLLIAPGLFLPREASDRDGLMIIFGAFLGLSILFKTGLKALTHKRWLLHGVREIFTYALLVAIPALAPLLVSGALNNSRITPAGSLALVSVLAISLYSSSVYRRADLNHEAQSGRGIVYLLSSHFFEHVLDCAYILLLVITLGSVR